MTVLNPANPDHQLVIRLTAAAMAFAESPSSEDGAGSILSAQAAVVARMGIGAPASVALWLWFDLGIRFTAEPGQPHPDHAEALFRGGSFRQPSSDGIEGTCRQLADDRAHAMTPAARAALRLAADEIGRLRWHDEHHQERSDGMPLIIENVTGEPYPPDTEPHRYVVKLNRRDLAAFECVRASGPGALLRAAADAVEPQPAPTDSGWRPSREAVARVIYDADPYCESGEWVEGYCVQPGGNLSWDQAQARDAEFSDPVFKSITEAAYRAADAILALTSEPDSGWRDIEGAPKDGTWFDAWRSPPKFTGPTWEPRVTLRWDDEEESWVWPCDTFEVFTVRGRELADMAIADGDFYTADDFTHWQPLPNPPALTSDGAPQT